MDAQNATIFSKKLFLKKAQWGRESYYLHTKLINFLFNIAAMLEQGITAKEVKIDLNSDNK